MSMKQPPTAGTSQSGSTTLTTRSRSAPCHHPSLTHRLLGCVRPQGGTECANLDARSWLFFGCMLGPRRLSVWSTPDGRMPFVQRVREKISGRIIKVVAPDHDIVRHDGTWEKGQQG